MNGSPHLAVNGIALVTWTGLIEAYEDNGGADYIGSNVIEWGSRDTVSKDEETRIARINLDTSDLATALLISNLITRKVAPAFAAGCPAVVKPATATPYTALALAVLAERAGIPKCVFSVVTGSSSAIGGEMTSNATVRKLSFTGSTEVGKLLMKQCADTV